jgi:hypothetical protein
MQITTASFLLRTCTHLTTASLGLKCDSLMESWSWLIH